MKFNVLQSHAAKAEVRGTIAWLSTQSQSGAVAWRAAWLDVLKSLEEFAESYGEAPENELVDIDLKQIIFKTRRGRPYRALYSIEGDDVLIHHVRGPGQDVLSADEFVSLE